MNVLFATSEAAPLIKTGGLADVSGALPAALRKLGADVRVLLPAYRAVHEALPAARVRAALPAHAGLPAAQLLEASVASGVPTYLLDCPPLFDRPGGPYLDATGAEWFDNALRFGLLSRAAALLGCASSPLRWRPHVIHCNDWQTGLAPAYLHAAHDADAASVLTIHNLAFQGIYHASLLPILGLPADTFSIDGLEFFGGVSFLKGGISYADALSTVSPTYAREIQSEPLGFGLQGLLAKRAAALSGILNGIDTDIWDPTRDPHIVQHYGPDTLDRKRANKRALQERMGLDVEPEVPLVGIVSRFTEQKGIDLVIEAMPWILRLPAQVAMVGTGDAAAEEAAQGLAARFPGRAAAFIGFEEALAHRIEAGADVFLMPSRFEPCGMNQMYSQRYGTPPVVRATGGLADSVVDCTPETLVAGTAAGFVFHPTTGLALLDSVERAVEAYRDPPTWRALQRNGMARDFSWRASAARYAEIYARIAPRRVPA
jgi:starch synthase